MEKKPVSTLKLHLTIKPYRNSGRCPECRRRGRIVLQITAFRRWKDLTLMGLKVLFWYAPKEIHCPRHGAGAGGDPLGTGVFTHHLSLGVVTLRAVSDHDPEGHRRDTRNAALDTVRSAAPNHHTVQDEHKIRGATTLLGVDDMSSLKAANLPPSSMIWTVLVSYG
jgi:transposase